MQLQERKKKMKKILSLDLFSTHGFKDKISHTHKQSIKAGCAFYQVQQEVGWKKESRTGSSPADSVTEKGEENL